MNEAMAVQVKERPILFSGEMVRRLLAGEKTQTRRVIKNLHVRTRHEVKSDLTFMPDVPLSCNPRWLYEAQLNQHGAVSARAGSGEHGWLGLKPNEFDFSCPYADGETVLIYGGGWRIVTQYGQRLWVRETWGNMALDGYPAVIAYRADPDEPEKGWGLPPAMKWKPSIHMKRSDSRLKLEILGIRIERVQDISPADCEAEGISREPFKNLMSNAMRSSFKQLWNSVNEKRGFGWNENPWVWVIEFERLTR